MSALQILEYVQRIGAQAIIAGFNTVARCVSESEASIEPVTLRHHNQQQAAWIRWHIRPRQHQFWKVKSALSASNKRWISPLQKIAKKFASIDISEVEKLKRLPDARKLAHVQSLSRVQSNKPLEWLKTIEVVPNL